MYTILKYFSKKMSNKTMPAEDTSSKDKKDPMGRMPRGNVRHFGPPFMGPPMPGEGFEGFPPPPPPCAMSAPPQSRKKKNAEKERLQDVEGEPRYEDNTEKRPKSPAATQERKSEAKDKDVREPRQENHHNRNDPCDKQSDVGSQHRNSSVFDTESKFSDLEKSNRFYPYPEFDRHGMMPPFDMMPMGYGPPDGMRPPVYMNYPEKPVDMSRMTMDFEGNYMDNNGQFMDPLDMPQHNEMDLLRENMNFRPPYMDQFPGDMDGCVGIPPMEMKRYTQRRKDGFDEMSPQELMENGMLIVTHVDYHLDETLRLHHTDQYDIGQNGQLIVRRGQPFMLTIEFHEEYNEEKHKIRFIFQIGEHPLPSKKSDIRFGLTDKWYPEEWGAKLVSRRGRMITVCVHPACDCIVGVWDFMIKTTVSGKGSYIFDNFEQIYILFNPWGQTDQVYMEDKDLLYEYVLNDHGHIFQGSGCSSVYQKPWNYGQFDEDILDIALYLMRQGFLEYCPQMSSPVRVARVLVHVINSPENTGVMMRFDSDNCQNGKKPTAWGGSRRILQQFIDTKEPVKYGQCWVFSGLLTTVCRALGIPCRTVTNFNSNHDSDDNLSVNVYLGEDEKGNIFEQKEGNVWNFHVWNDVWMSRSDLPVGYCGWQAVDPTPQEASDGIYCCGPAPLKAIKNGEVNQTFDTNFIFSELNADRVYWKKNHRSGKWEIVHIDRNALGKFIYTKYPNCKPGHNRSGGLMDITFDYKLVNGSEYDRIDVINVHRKKMMLHRAKKSSHYQEDVEFRISERESVMVGQDFNITLHCRNTGQDQRYVSSSVYCKIVDHFGEKIGICRELHVNNFFDAKNSKMIVMNVAPEDYMPFLGRDNNSRLSMRIMVYCKVKQTDQMFVFNDSYQLDWPYLTIEVPPKIRVRDEVMARISFVNPLDIPLTNCELMLEGNGFERIYEIRVSDVPPHGNFMEEIVFIGRKIGEKQLVATFYCQELCDIVGSSMLQVFK
ncbi:hemocyte protein-glutamine gamma-glutamyltransferase-like isoform X1 [Octopus vulgaris]|uniref:Hemocyte protein-glutamine gamma-glutamyltransferase-like isoform X1 n=1 Tax=Octopus vulgaris TaxID=6645 RepID=A0AA36EY45_OCTVU|nr:hemocyte protein-glutamine gamma-glutamyltransferase-like isoform X1 [Octopus vulgaris]